jgi:enterochelin esterase-like enzyme
MHCLNFKGICLELALLAAGILSAYAEPILIEAEKFNREGGSDTVKITPDRPGTTGGYCVTGDNTAGHWLEWDFTVPETGSYTVVLRYAGGRTWNVYREISIDGTVADASFSRVLLGPTGGFGRNSDEWKNQTVAREAGKAAEIKLSKGSHTLRITNRGGDGDNGAVNLDLVAFLSPGTDPEKAIVVPEWKPPVNEIIPNEADYAKPLAVSQLKTFAIKSTLLGGRLYKINVYLPQGYDRTKKYPVLYLLHGLNSDNTQWIPNMGLEKRADALIAEGKIKPLIIAAPSYDPSWGINSAPAFRIISDNKQYPFYEGPYEDYIVKEVIPFVEKYFSAGQNRTDRFIGGISMGGFAALHIGIAHSDLFSRIGGHSPALMVPPGYDTGCLYRKPHTEDVIHPRALAEKADLSATAFWLDCGTEDQLIYPVKQFADYLQSRHISVHFQSGPGVHSQTYNIPHLDEYLIFYAGI